jgi:hypothetical protein
MKSLYQKYIWPVISKLLLYLVVAAIIFGYLQKISDFFSKSPCDEMYECDPAHEREEMHRRW